MENGNKIIDKFLRAKCVLNENEFLLINNISDAKSTEKLQTLDWKYLMVGIVTGDKFTVETHITLIFKLLTS